MHRDEFEARYRLLQTALRSGGAITHHALSPEGAVVMVHVFDGDPESVADLERRTAAAVESGDSRILERLVVDDHPVVVTRFILDFQGLDHWLPAVSSGAPSTESPPVGVGGGSGEDGGDPAPAPDDGDSGPEPGDFTRAFGAVDVPAPAQESAPPPTPPASADQPGEFTRMFRAADVPAEPPPAATPPAPPGPEVPGPGPSGAEAGEFTRMFRAQEVEPKATESEGDRRSDSGSGASPPGEFTRQFGALSPPEPASPDDDRAPPPPAEGQGEFTREFGAARRDPPPVPETGAGEFTRQFGALGPPPSGPPPPSERERATHEEPLPRYGDPAAVDGPPEPDFGGGRGSGGRESRPPVRSEDLPEPRYSRPEPSPAPMADRSPTEDADEGLSFGESGGDYAERLYAPLDPGPPPPSPAATPPAGEVDSGPGEYTRIIQGIRPPEPEKQAEPAPAAPAADAAPAEESPPSTRGLVWALVIIAVLAIVLVVVLVLTAGSGSPDPSALPG